MEYLSYWLLFVTALSVLGSVVGMVSPTQLKKQQFSRRPDLVNPLTGRLFGAWTLLACGVRATCALYVHEKGIYTATLISFFIALGIYLNETLVTKTVSFKAATSPFIVASTSIFWMISQYNHYITY